MQKEDTKEKLLKSAKEEFLTFGYQKASLRRICKNAGVTTGALYFFFQDKADVFDALVADIAAKIMHMLKYHTANEEESCSEQKNLDMEQDIQFGKELISYYYQHKEEVDLLFNCSQGSHYESFKDTIVAYIQERYTKIIGLLVNEENQIFNECTIHWFSHVQTESILHILSHDFDEERALEQVEIVVNFLRAGFDRLYQIALSKE